MDLVKKFPIAVYHHEKGFRCLNKQDYSTVHAQQRTKRRKMDIKEFVYGQYARNTMLVLYRSHFYVLHKQNRDSECSRILKELDKPKPSPTFEIFSSPRRGQIQVMDKTWEEWIDVNLQIENEIYDFLMNQKTVVLTGAAGSGKSEIIKHLRTRMPDSIIGSHQAIIGTEIYRDVGGGETLYHMFKSFGKHMYYFAANDEQFVKHHPICLKNILLLDEFSNMRLSWIDQMNKYLKFVARKMIEFEVGDYASKDPRFVFGGFSVLFAGDAMQLFPVKCKELDCRAFLHPILNRACRNGRCFNLIAPMRFIHPDIVSDEKMEYATAMANVRFNLSTEWLEQKLSDCHRERIPWEEIDMDVQHPPIFICMFHDDIKGEDTGCRNIHNKICARYMSVTLQSMIESYPAVVESLPLEWRGLATCKEFRIHEKSRAKMDMLFYVGCPFLITTNDCISTLSEICNGCEVVYKGQIGLGLKFEWHEQPFVLYPWKGRGKQWHYPLRPSHARTVDNMQGSTRDRIILCLPKKLRDIHGKSLMRKHQVYTAISRAKTMDGFIYTGDKDILQSLVCDRMALNFSREPECNHVPLVKTKTLLQSNEEYRDYVCTTNQYGVIQKYTVTNKRKESDGSLVDFVFSEALLYTKHTFVFDIETLVKDGLFNYCTSAKYYYNGYVADPYDLYESVFLNCITNDGVVRKFPTHRRTRNLYFEWDQDKDCDPSRDFVSLVVAIIIDHIDNENFKMFPIFLCGFNSNAFDMIPMFKELLSKQSSGLDMTAEIMQVGASGNKGFRYYYHYIDQNDKPRKQIVLQTHDIIQLYQNSLEENCNSFVAPYFDKTEDEFMKAFCNPIEYMIYKGFSDREIKSIVMERYNQDGESKLHNAFDRMSYIRKLLDNRDKIINLQATYRYMSHKGESPLFYMNKFKEWETYTNARGKEIIGFKDCNNPIDLEAEMRTPTGGLDFLKCYYPREVKKAKLDYAKRPEYYRQYKILDNIREYVHQDVDMTDLFYRAAANKIYQMQVPETTRTISTPHEPDQIVTLSKEMRLSILRFDTMAQLSGYNAVLNMDKNMSKEMIFKRKIVVDQCLYDERLYRLFRQTPGGKVLPRYFQYEQNKKDPNDKGMVYLDETSMYVYAMQSSMYPAGNYTELYWENEKDRAVLERMKDCINCNRIFHFNNPNRTTCWRGIVTRSMHPREMDPPAGIKLPVVGHSIKYLENYMSIPKYGTKTDKLYYLNRPLTGEECNITCEDIVRAKGKIHRIWYAVFWEKEVPYYKGYMTNLMQDKIQAEKDGDKAGRKNAKDKGNIEYGNSGKQNFNTDTYWAETDQEIIKFEDMLCNGNYKIKWTDFPTNGSRLYSVTNLTFEASDRPTPISSFTLAYSKRTINRVIEIGFGKERHSEKKFARSGIYGDTDSLCIPYESYQRIRQHDKRNPGNEILSYPDTPESQLSGKFTDELADAARKIEKYPKDYFNMRNDSIVIVTGFYTGGPKLYVCKAIRPDPRQSYGMAWINMFKFRRRGIPDGAAMWVEQSTLNIWEKKLYSMVQKKAPVRDGYKYIREYISGDNEFSYELLRFCLRHKKVLHTTKRKIARHLVVDNDPEMSFSMHEANLPRRQFENPYGGRVKVGDYTMPPDWEDRDSWPQEYIDDAYRKAKHMLDAFT
jgi:hypothetical protein